MTVMIIPGRGHDGIENPFGKTERGSESFPELMFFEGQFFRIGKILIQTTTAATEDRTKGFGFL